MITIMPIAQANFVRDLREMATDKKISSISSLRKSHETIRRITKRVVRFAKTSSHPASPTNISMGGEMTRKNRMNRLQNMKFTPHLIALARENLTGMSQLKNLADCEPVEPLGWFRFLHDHYLGWYVYLHFDQIFMQVICQGWENISHIPGLFSEANNPILLKVVNRHGWSIGLLGLDEIAHIHWSDMTRLSRGAFLAGLSELHASEDMWENVKAELPNVDFSAESLCQLSCNAIKHNRADILPALLQAPTDLTTHIHRGDGDCYPESRLPDILGNLSHRLIDLVLEAALIRSNHEAVKLALDHGADPDIPIWVLERSYNERHCALSFAIFRNDIVLAELFLQYGASPSGNSFSGNNYPFFQAFQKMQFDMAEKLFTKTTYEGRYYEPASELGGSEHDIFLSGVSGRFFGHFGDEVDWANQVIGKIIPLVSIDEKESYYHGDAQGGYYRTTLGMVIGRPPLLEKYEALGMDVRLSAEEICTAVECNAYDSLKYLLEKQHGAALCAQVLDEITKTKPQFSQR